MWRKGWYILICHYLHNPGASWFISVSFIHYNIIIQSWFYTLRLSDRGFQQIKIYFCRDICPRIGNKSLHFCIKYSIQHGKEKDRCLGIFEVLRKLSISTFYLIYDKISCFSYEEWSISLPLTLRMQITSGLPIFYFHAYFFISTSNNGP